MTEADLARRIYENLNWSVLVDSDGPLVDGIGRMDVWSQLQGLWQAPDEKFVEGLYLLLLSRPADARGLANFRGALAAGLPRTELVRTMAMSEEARITDLDVSWLPRLAASPGILCQLFSLATVKLLVRRVLRRVSRLGAPQATAGGAPRSSGVGAKGPAKGEL